MDALGKRRRKMRALYNHIEASIKAAGYMGPISGEEVYEDICEEIEDKEQGTYLFMSKKEDNILFEYKIDVMKDEFNLVYLLIHTPDQVYKVQFDE